MYQHAWNKILDLAFAWNPLSGSIHHQSTRIAWIETDLDGTTSMLFFLRFRFVYLGDLELFGLCRTCLGPNFRLILKAVAFEVLALVAKSFKLRFRFRDKHWPIFFINILLPGEWSPPLPDFLLTVPVLKYLEITVWTVDRGTLWFWYHWMRVSGILREKMQIFFACFFLFRLHH